MRFQISILPLAMVALLMPAAADAHPRKTVAPPGASGISQYAEVVPSASGAVPPGTGAGGPVPPGTGAGAGPSATGSGTGGVLSAAQQHRLDRLGPDGRALAAAAEATGPPSVVNGEGARAASVGGQSAPSQTAAQPDSARLPSSTGDSAASLILDAAVGRGSGGLGWFLPAFMLMSAIAAAAYGVRRRMHA